jgi:hypothetical protein
MTPGCPQSPAGNVQVVVNALPNVTLDFSTIDTQCVTVSSLPLTGGSPAGGTYSGTGVAGNNFNPSSAGPGTWTITYQYTDTNGCTNSASASIYVDVCTGVFSESEENTILVFPNPVSEQLNILSGKGAKIILYDGIGKEVLKTENLTGLVIINVKDYPQGTYFLKISNGNSSFMKKITVMQE